MLFLLDGLQEDLNRIQKKPYIEKPDSTDEMVHNTAALKEFADKCWDIYKARNDSVVTDLFAGMYKSTVVCPECDKVSIIFDPFNNLTLQLPIENVWSRSIFFFPLGEHPIRVDVDIDKNSSIKALKEYVGKKMNVDASRIVMSETFHHKFYKMFDNTSSIAESHISNKDEIAMYELESVPTSYDPDKPKKFSSLLYTSLTSDEAAVPFDSPKADRTLIPVFHRLHKPANSRFSQHEPFGAPSYIVVNREEAFDYESIFWKLIGVSQNLTTRNLFQEQEQEQKQEQDVSMSSTTAEDSDTVVTGDDDIDSADPTVKAASVDGEDGLVDVSMRDANDSQANDERTGGRRVTKSKIPSSLRSLFRVKFSESNSAVPTGFSSLGDSKELPLISSRLPKPEKRTTQKQKLNALARKENSQSSSDDELGGIPQTINLQQAKSDDDDDSDGSSSSQTNNDSGSETSSDTNQTTSTSVQTNGKQKLKSSSRQSLPKVPLIRPGEAIVLDWNADSYDALFGADLRDQSPLRGAPTWENVRVRSDPELAKKRELRYRRKKQAIGLSECLDEFGREEILSENDAWYCPRCKEHRRASKKFELWRTPDILVMHLKRFSANRSFRDKIDALVDFPTELDMTGRVQMPEEGKSLMYDLIAVDNHYGGLGGGHYTAFAKNFVDDCWYEYNGTLVNPFSLIQPIRIFLYFSYT